MAAEWYYAKGDKQIGPISVLDLKSLSQSGQLTPDDMVWKEGMDGWVPASQVKGLFPNGALQTKKTAPPPLTVVSSAQQSVAQHPQLPWSEEERTASNPMFLWAKVGAAVCVLIGLLCIASVKGAIFCLPFFSAAFLILAMTIFKHLMVLHGRWVPADAGKGWVEFAFGGIYRQEDGLVGTFVVLKNKKFLDILSSGRLVDSWRILSMDMKSLDIQDMTGKTRSFKKGKTLAEKQATLFSSDRTYLLTEKWEPVEGNGPAVQFTKDGAMIRFDGFAARYTFSGEEPNEVITVHVNDKDSIELKVLSLSRDEMVLTGDGGSVHYKRGVSISAAEAKRRSDAYHDKLKAVGKGVLLTVGAIGTGIAVLGVAAAAAGAAGGGSGDGPRSDFKETRCDYCNGTGWKSEFDGRQVRCHSCGGHGVHRTRT